MKIDFIASKLQRKKSGNKINPNAFISGNKINPNAFNLFQMQFKLVYDVDS